MKNPTIICTACDREKSIKHHFCSRCEELYPRDVLQRWVLDSFLCYTNENVNLEEDA